MNGKVTIYLILLLVLVLAGSAKMQLVKTDPDSLEIDKQAKINDIRKLMEVSGARELSTTIMDQMIPQLKALTPDVPEEFWDAFVAEINFDELINLSVSIYDKYLTHDEIRTIVQFYESPAGKKLVSVLPQIAEESMRVGQTWGMEITRKAVAEFHKDKIEQERLLEDRLRAKHIVVKTEVEAREILTMLQDGTPFDRLARERSIDQSSVAKGGDLGPFNRGDFFPAFEEAVLKLNPGEVSDIVPSHLGYHIIMRTSHLAEGYIILGNVYMEEKKFDEAVIEFDKAISIYPQYAEAHYSLGEAYHEKGSFEEAKAEYKAAIEINPDDPDAHQGLGKAYLAREQLDEAEKEFERTVELDSAYVEALVDLADVYDERGEFNLAEEKLHEAIDMNPDYLWASYSLGCLYHDYLRYDKAISVFEELIEKIPEHNYSHIKLADMYRHVGRYDSARTECEKGIGINPENEWGYRMLGHVLADQERYDEAIEWFRKAVEVEPDDAWAHGFLGRYGYLQKQQFTEAISEIQKAIELEPDEVLHIHKMGWIYLLKGEYESAQGWYDRAIKMDPDDREAYSELAELYIATGSFQDADSMVSRAKELSKKPGEMIHSLFMETLVKVLSEKEYDQALKELIALMKQGRYFNLKAADFMQELRFVEKSIDNYTLDPERKRLAERIILLVKGEIKPEEFE